MARRSARHAQSDGNQPGFLFPGLDGIGKTTAENLQRETYSLRDLLSPMLSAAELHEPGD